MKTHHILYENPAVRNSATSVLLSIPSVVQFQACCPKTKSMKMGTYDSTFMLWVTAG